MTDLFDQIDPPRKITLITRACRCGSHHFRLEPGKAMHAAGLRCAICDCHAGWLSKAEYAEYLNPGWVDIPDQDQL